MVGPGPAICAFAAPREGRRPHVSDHDRTSQIAAGAHPPPTQEDPYGHSEFRWTCHGNGPARARAEAEASKLHQDITSVKTRGLDAIGKGRDKVAGVRARVSQVETFVNELEGSNGGPLPSSSTSSGASSTANEAADTPTSAVLPQASPMPETPAAAPDASPAPIGASPDGTAPTTVLNVNGVAAS
jgi:hypothetical protein